MYYTITTLPRAGPNRISPSSTNQLVTCSHSDTIKKLSLNCHSIHNIDRRARFHTLVQEYQPNIIIECELQIYQT